MAHSTVIALPPMNRNEALPSRTVFRLPDPLASFPWKRSINPYYEVCKAESEAWAQSFHAFGPKAQAAFTRCDFSLLASLAFPKLSREGCRVACDLMMVFFVFDDWSDVSTAAETRKQADSIMDALYHPEVPRPRNEWVGGELTRQFWLNACQTASATAQERFIRGFKGYTDAVVEQSSDRDRSRIRGIASYFEVRRETVGAKPSFAINQLQYDLSDAFMNHSIVRELTTLCIDMIIMGNDLHSYNVEQSRGDDAHNVVTVVMAELHLELQEALDYVGHLYQSHIHSFLKLFDQMVNELSKTSDLANQNALSYIDSLGNWVRANDQWSYESARYYGCDGLEVLETREVVLQPKKISISLES